NDGSYSVSSEEGLPLGFTFNGDGTKLYIVGAFDAAVNQYSLTTPYTITSGVSHDGVSASFSSDEDAPTGITFNNGGSKMYIVGLNSSQVDQYSLTTNYDVTAGYSSDGVAFDLSTTEGAPEDIAFSPSGEKMFVIGSAGDEINQYTLTTAFTVTSGVTAEDVLDISSFDGEANGFAFGKNGSEIFFVGASNDQVYSQKLDVGGFSEVSDNDGSVEGLLLLTITGETFTNSGSTLTESTDYVIANLPTGLSPTITVAADGASAFLTLSGNASSNLTFDDVESLVFTFENSAFTGNDASAVANAVSAQSFAGIDFDGVPSLSYGDGINLENGIFSTETIEIGNVQLNIEGLTFSNDGSKAFFVDDPGNGVWQYDLGTAYDLSTITGRDGIEVFNSFGELIGVIDIAFNETGSKLFVLGEDQDKMFEFNLSSNFDITSDLRLVRSFATGSFDSNPLGFTFGDDGSTIVISGDAEVNQYSVTIPYTLSGMSRERGFFLRGDDVAFNEDGSELYLLDDDERAIRIIKLSTNYQISPAISNDDFFPVTEFSVAGLAINNDLSQVLVTRRQDEIAVYEIPVARLSERSANDGGIEGSILISLEDETFASAGSTLSAGTDYIISGVPDGLSPVITVAGDGFTASLSFTGNATQNTITADSLVTFSLSFESSAFSTFESDQVANVNADLNVIFDFEDNPVITYGTRFDLEDGLTDLNTFNIEREDDTSEDVFFGDQGRKMYVAGRQFDRIYQYTLDVPYDLSAGNVSLDGSFSVVSADSDPYGVTFSPDGKKMLFVSVPEINEYRLDTPWDLTLADNVTLFRARSLTGGLVPTGVHYSKDGDRLYLSGAGSAGARIYQYSIRDFSINSFLTQTDVVSLSDLSAIFHDVTFSPDGMRMFVLGNSGQKVGQYTLGTPFDLGGTITFEDAIDIPIASTGFEFNQDGSKLFTVGSSEDTVVEYAINTGGFSELEADNGAVEGEIIISLTNDTFTNAGSTFT
ncbi:MAG: hypothetical protein AAF789_13125, partial [Bacteroidota bacterium]